MQSTDREVGAFFICICHTEVLPLYCGDRKVMREMIVLKIYLDISNSYTIFAIQ